MKGCSTSALLATSPTLWPSWQATMFPKTSVMTTDTRTLQTPVLWERPVETVVLSTWFTIIIMSQKMLLLPQSRFFLFFAVFFCIVLFYWKEFLKNKMIWISKSTIFFQCCWCVFTFTAADGCLENAPDTAEFSREFQKHQHLFDPEHDYSALAKWVSTEQAWNKLFVLSQINQTVKMLLTIPRAFVLSKQKSKNQRYSNYYDVNHRKATYPHMLTKKWRCKPSVQRFIWKKKKDILY